MTFAKEHKATVIITINNAWTLQRRFLDDLEAYQWGDFDETNSDPCILVTVTGPGAESYSLELPYKLHGEQVAFGEVATLQRSVVTLLPEWPEGAVYPVS